MPGFNPNEPRDKLGKWTDSGISSAIQKKIDKSISLEQNTIDYGTDIKINILKTLQWGKENNIPMITTKTNPDILARTDIDTNIMEINSGSDFWKDPVRNMQKAFEQGQFSTENPLHIIVHETAHMKFKGLPYSWNGIEDKKIAGEVSLYAKDSPDEFIAETFTGLKFGKKYSYNVLSLYNKLVQKKYN